MALARYPEVLAHDWIPPEPIARDEAVGALRPWLEGARPAEEPLLIEGPPGAGTSTVARWGARLRAERDRAPDGRRGHVVAVRVRWCAGTGAVAGALLRAFDEGFREHGFPIAEILAGFLRRVLRDGRPTIVLLDDLGPGAPEIGPILRALLRPSRFLPEGVERPPTIRVILAGASGASGAVGQAAREGVRLDARVHLPALGAPELRCLVADRARRALGVAAPPALVDRIVHRALIEGRTTARAVELLRGELLDEEERAWAAPPPARGPSTLAPLEPRLWRAIESACGAGAAPLAAVRAWEERLARADGASPMPTTTFWRRLLRLEREGRLVREIRAGGSGGSRSTIRLVAPAPYRLTRGTLRASGADGPPGGVRRRRGPGADADPTGGSGRGPARPAWAI
jgi:hypothetical protein